VGNREAGKVHARDKDDSVTRQRKFYALLLILHLTNNSLHSSPNLILAKGSSLLIEVSFFYWDGFFF